jgi:hypothetical protein
MDVGAPWGGPGPPGPGPGRLGSLHRTWDSDLACPLADPLTDTLIPETRACYVRLFVQIQRILSINRLTLVTSDVVEAASATLVIGDTGP